MQDLAHPICWHWLLSYWYSLPWVPAHSCYQLIFEFGILECEDLFAETLSAEVQDKPTGQVSTRYSLLFSWARSFPATLPCFQILRSLPWLLGSNIQLTTLTDWQSRGWERGRGCSPDCFYWAQASTLSTPLNSLPAPRFTTFGLQTAGELPLPFVKVLSCGNLVYSFLLFKLIPSTFCILRVAHSFWSTIDMYFCFLALLSIIIKV